MESIKIDIPFSMRWKVSKQEVQASLSQDKSFGSKQFPLEEYPDVLYGINIFRSSDTRHVGHVVIGLSVTTKRTVDAKFRTSILSSANYFYEMTKIFDKPLSAGFALETMEHFFDPSNNFFVDDYATITLEGIFSLEKEREKPKLVNGITNKKTKSLGEALWDRDNKDFGFTVDGQVLMVHKLIVSTKSPVFDRMIECGLKESKDNKVAIIDFDYETVELALKFCYDIDIEDLLTIYKSFKLLQFSDKYDIEDLKDSMEAYIYNQRSPMNICEIVNASILSNASKLRDRCFDFMLKCMNKSIYIMDLDKLDRDFAFNLFKASFSHVL